MGHDNTIALTIGAAFVTLFMAGYGYVSKIESDYRDSAAKLAIAMNKIDFSKSCTEEGLFNSLNQKNCIQQGGYTVVRFGLETIIYATKTAQHNVVYRLSPDRRRLVPGNSAELEDVRQAFLTATHQADATGILNQTIFEFRSGSLPGSW